MSEKVEQNGSARYAQVGKLGRAVLEDKHAYHAWLNMFDSELKAAEERGAAAERERITEIIKGERLGTSDDPTIISYDMAIEYCLDAIRSTAQ